MCLEDGSKKEQVYQWDNCSINEWLIHRDVLYFTKQVHENIDGKIKENVQLMSLSLTDPAKKEKPVFSADADLDIFSGSVSWSCRQSALLHSGRIRFDPSSIK